MNPATIKFLDIFFGIVAYELQHSKDGHLLSEQCDRWVADRPIVARTIIGTVGSVLVLHLANMIPPKYDVMHLLIWKSALSRIKREKH
jgi:hypothetical protein